MGDRLSHDDQLAWLRAHAESEDGHDVPAPDGTLAACLRVVQAAGGWYYDPVLDPEGVLEIVEAAAVIDADVVRVLEYVSRGRGFVGVERYPDSEARRALGRIREAEARRAG
jgi:hypothetical protein